MDKKQKTPSSVTTARAPTNTATSNNTQKNVASPSGGGAQAVPEAPRSGGIGPTGGRRRSSAAEQLSNLRASLTAAHIDPAGNAHAAQVAATAAAAALASRGFVDTSGMNPYHIVPASGTTAGSEKERLAKRRLSGGGLLRFSTRRTSNPVQTDINAAAQNVPSTVHEAFTPSTASSRVPMGGGGGVAPPAGWAALLSAAAASAGVTDAASIAALLLKQQQQQKSAMPAASSTTAMQQHDDKAGLDLFKNVAAKFGLDLTTTTVVDNQSQPGIDERRGSDASNEMLIAAAAAFAEQQQQFYLYQQHQLLLKQQQQAANRPPHALRKRIFLEPVETLNAATAAAAAAGTEAPDGTTTVSQAAAGAAAGGAADAGQPVKYQVYDVNDYVDYTADRMVGAYVKRNIVGAFVNSGYFRTFVMLVILFNAILIGIQTDEPTSRQNAALLGALDQIIFAIFLWEIVIKWVYSFDDFWWSGWNCFDFLIVGVLLIGDNLKALSSARILRILRVVRAFRSLKGLESFKMISIVFTTIIKSVPDLINVGLLLGILGTVLSVYAVTVLQKSSPDNFASFTDAIWLFFTTVTQDGWAGTTNQWLGNKDDPRFAIDGVMVAEWYAFFILTFLLGAFVLYNLFVAVMMAKLDETIVETRKEDLEEAAEHNEEVNKEQARMTNPAEPLTKLDEAVPIDPLLDAISDFPENDRQTRAQMPFCLSKLTAVQLQKFVFLQATLAQNLSEYKEHRDQIEAILRQVKKLNPQWEAMEAGAREEAAGAGEHGSEAGASVHRTVRIGKFSRQSLSHTLEKFHHTQGDILSELLRLAPDTSSDVNLDRVLNDASRRTANKLKQSLRASLTVSNAVNQLKNPYKSSLRR